MIEQMRNVHVYYTEDIDYAARFPSEEIARTVCDLSTGSTDLPYAAHEFSEEHDAYVIMLQYEYYLA